MATHNVTLTDLGTRVSSLEQRVDYTEASIKMHYSKYPLVFKVVSIAASIIATLGSVIIAFYVFRYVPKEIGAELSPLKTNMAVVQTQLGDLIANPNKTTEELRLSENRTNERMNRIEGSLKELTDRLNGYIDKRLISTPAKLKESYRRALASPRKLDDSIIVAEDLWFRAQQKGLPLSRRDIQNLAEITLPMLDRNFDDTTIKGRAWHLVESFAAGNTNVRTRPKGKMFPCKDGQTSLGGGITVSNVTVADCRVNINEGLILNNVRFIRSEFEVIQSPEGSEFLRRISLSHDLKVTMGDETRNNRRSGE